MRVSLRSGCAFAVVAALGCAGTADGDPDLPCVIDWSPTAITLQSDTTISRHDVGWQVVRDARGNFYAGSMRGAELLKWSSDGKLVAAVGGPGDGPGEFGSAMGMVDAFVTAGDSFYIRDTHRHWVVLDPELRMVRYDSIGPMIPLRGRTHFLPSGTILSTANESGVPRAAAAIMTRHGQLVRTFAARPGPIPSYGRGSAYVGNGLVWLAPPQGPELGYRIEVWDTSGVLRDSIIRTVDWFPAESANEEQPAHESTVMPFQHPSLGVLLADTAGLVWAFASLPRDAGSKARVQAAGLEGYAQIIDKEIVRHVEVFDAASHRLLASRRLTDPLSTPVFSGRLVLQVDEDDDGFRKGVIRELTLKDRSGGECHAEPPRN